MKTVSAHKQLLHTVAMAYGITAGQILGKTRTAKIANARQIAAYLMRELYHLSFPQIGAVIGGRDHSTIIYAHQKIAQEIRNKPDLRLFIDSILQSTYSGNGMEVFNIPQEEVESYSEIQTVETSDDIVSTNINLDLTERESNILSEYRRGLTLEEMGGHFGITRERVRQISRKALMKELGSLGKQGLKINIREYILAEKKARMARRNQIPEDIRKQILIEISNLNTSKVNELSVKYSISIDKLKKEFSQIKEYLEGVAEEKAQRWSRYYIKCRQCGTQQIRHKIGGYCVNCYPKSERFKELQRKSVDRHRDQRKVRNKIYALEYAKRPEVKEKYRKLLDLKNYGGNREIAIERNGYRCTRCGIGREESLQKSGRDFCVIRVDGNQNNNSLGNLKSLCRNCFNETLRERLNPKK